MRMPVRTLRRTGLETASAAAAVSTSSTGRKTEGVKVARPIAVSS